MITSVLAGGSINFDNGLTKFIISERIDSKKNGVQLVYYKHDFQPIRSCLLKVIFHWSLISLSVAQAFSTAVYKLITAYRY